MTDKKTAVQTTVPTVELLGDAIEALSEGIAVFDKNLRLVQCNQRYIQSFDGLTDIIHPGIEIRDLITVGTSRSVLDADFAAFEGWISALPHNPELEDLVLEVQQATRVFEVRLQRTKTAGLVVVRTDITRRKKAETRLRDRENLLTTVLDTTPVSVVLARLRDAKVLFRSKEAISRFGEAEFAYSHYESRAARDAYVTLLKEQGFVDGYLLTAKCQDGSTFDASCSGRLVDIDGETCVISALTDLSEKIKSAALIGHILENCPAPIQMTNAETGEVLFTSPVSKQQFGQPDTAKSMYADPQSRIRYLDILKRDGEITDYHTELVNADGETFPAAISARLITYQNEPVIVSHSRDLTQERATQAELALQRDHMAQTEKVSALSELLAGVAHQLNNPLSVVVGHTLMLQEDVDDPELLKQIVKVSNAANRCTKIVKTFLTMAREKPLQMARTDINDVVRTAVDVVRHGDFSDQVDVSMQLEESLPAIQSNPDQLTQVVLNLIINAEHAIVSAGQGSKITVQSSLGASGTEICVTIKDDGPGISDMIKGQIFDPFFSTKDGQGATGMGLTLSHRIVTANGGKLQLLETSDAGTCFVITLPIMPLIETAVVSAEPADPAADAKSVLIVDDEVDVAELSAEILRRDGYDVDLTCIARDAMGMLEQKAYDVVLSDLNMPDLDGRGFFDAIKSQFPHLANRTGFLTGDTLGKSSQTFLAEAERPFLEKPVSPKELRQFVTDILVKAGKGS